MTVYMVATTKPWNIAAFEAHRVTLPGSWHLVEQPENLTAEVVERLSPRYIFFPHWFPTMFWGRPNASAFT